MTLVQLRLATEIRFVSLADELSRRVARLVGFRKADAEDLGLAVREAVVNAMKHGNGLNPDRRVDLHFAFLEGEVLETRVRDEGDGFDPSSVRDPRGEVERLLDSGRGLLLMRAHVDEVEFQFVEGWGMEVRLLKRVPPRASRRAARSASGPARGSGR